MFHDDGGLALNGVEVFSLENVAGLGGCKHLASQGNGGASIFRGDGSFAGESFVDAHHEFRNVVEPGELLVVDHQAEQFARGDVAVDAFVVAALHIEKSFMQAEKSEAQSDEPLPSR